MKQIKVAAGVLWLALLAWGVYGVVLRLAQGELITNYGSYVPWGLWVAAKVYFVGLGVGAGILAFLIYAFDIKRFQNLVRPSLITASICLILGIIIIAFDLGHMFRSFEIFYRPNFSSMLAWSSWFTFVSLAFCLFVLLYDLANPGGHGGTSRILGVIGLVLLVAFSGGNGAEFAALISSPYWHSTLGPIMSIATALLSGFALVLMMGCILSKRLFPSEDQAGESLKILGRVVAGLILLVLVFEWSEFSISAWYGVGEASALRSNVLFGENWYLFWIVHLGIGSIIPLILLFSRPQNMVAIGLSSALVFVSVFAIRMNLVLPGQTTPAMEGLQEAYVDNRLLFSYMPSAAEWAVLAFCVALGVAAFYLVFKLLPLARTESSA
ncbi:MAG: polysulfide reductase NrfD [Desulfohalobiaceae bacterium]|nr:polysulfide reductase NrfD [Desulfohalobiaceae bacterium]